jgi:hypothetical protein
MDRQNPAIKLTRAFRGTHHIRLIHIRKNSDIARLLPLKWGNAVK